jgi:hypothetical protein
MSEAINRAVRQRAKAELFISELIGNRMKKNQDRYAIQLLDDIYKKGIAPGMTVKCKITFEFTATELINFISGKVKEEKQQILTEELFEI